MEDVEVAFRRLGLVTESHGQEILEIFQTQARTRGPMHTPQEWEYRVTVEAWSRWNPATLGHQIDNEVGSAAVGACPGGVLTGDRGFLKVNVPGSRDL